MPKQTVEALINGGQATAAPPLGPALGPLGVNIGEVIAEINKKTAEFKGMQVPVKVIVDSDTKSFEITIGTPPASALIKGEAKIDKGSGTPNTEKIADLKIEQIIKIAKMKEDALLGKSLKEKVKEIIGTCNSMGLMVEGVDATEALKMVDQGKFDEEIRTEKTDISAEEMKELEEERKKLEKEMKEKRAEFEAKSKKIISEMSGKPRSDIKAKLVEEKIPNQLIEELLPAEAAEEGKGDAKPEAAEKKE
ncbi:50S ribosomal protein L11 [Candidatus Woesearchaeota archaeon]|nr:50S ribosomal protein L11 [Candidatus Woesearchaeota archaeon]